MQKRSEIISEKSSTGICRVDPVCMTEELRNRAKSELLEDENKRTQSLELLRSLLKEEENLRWQEDDLFLLAFLRVKKYDVDRALHLMKRMYHTIGRHRHIYYNLTAEYLRKLMEENCFCILPDRNDDGSVVVIHRFSACDPTIFSAEERLVMSSLGLLVALRDPSTQVAGVQLVADFKGFGFRHFLQATPSVIFFMYELMQSTIPIRMRSIHVCNQNVFFPFMWRVFKRLISPKLRERIHIHGKDMKSLHKFINPAILPAEWEGRRPPFDNAEWRKTMDASFDYVKHVLSFGYEKYLKKYRKNSSDSVKSLTLL